MDLTNETVHLFYNFQSSKGFNFTHHSKPVALRSKCLLPAVRSKGHRFESPSGHELLTLSDCHSASGRALRWSESSIKGESCQQCPLKVTLPCLLCHPYFNICCDTSLNSKYCNMRKYFFKTS